MTAAALPLKELAMRDLHDREFLRYGARMQAWTTERMRILLAIRKIYRYAGRIVLCVSLPRWLRWRWWISRNGDRVAGLHKELLEVEALRPRLPPSGRMIGLIAKLMREVRGVATKVEEAREEQNTQAQEVAVVLDVNREALEKKLDTIQTLVTNHPRA